MAEDKIEQKLRSWSEETLLLLRSLLPLMAPVSRHHRWSTAELETISHLLTASARSSESAILLTAYGQVWDAEILVRSVFEGSLKFAYILQNTEKFGERHREYSFDHFQISLLKDHRKVKDLLAALPNGDDSSWTPFRERLLQDEEATAIASEYPRSRRRALETRWGFAGVISDLAGSGDPLFRGMTALAEGYSRASHILHADTIGTHLPFEIEQRSAERREAIQLAHGVRLLSDVLSCLQIRLLVGYRFIGEDPAPLREANKLIEQLVAGFGSAYEDWMEVEYPKEK